MVLLELIKLHLSYNDFGIHRQWHEKLPFWEPTDGRSNNDKAPVREGLPLASCTLENIVFKHFIYAFYTTLHQNPVPLLSCYMLAKV